MSGNASVEGNTTEGGGGGIYNYGGIVTMSDSVSVKNNSAGYSGGGIVNISDSGEVNISDNASVVGNTTEGYGGGITNSGGSVKISDNVLIEENTATSFGGGIYNAGTMEMSGSANITKNSSEQYGAGIFNFGTLKLTENTSVVGNTTETNGGGIFNFKTLILGGAINISDNKAGDVASNLVLAERGYEDGEGTYNQLTDYSVMVESPLTNTTPIGVSVWKVGQAPTDIKIEEFDTGSDSINDDVIGIGVDGNEIVGGWVVTSSGYKTNNDGDVAYKYFTSEDPNRILLISKEGEVYLKLHTHTWTYTANGDTVIANCTNDDELACQYKENGVTLKIKAEDMTYTGEQYEGASVTNNITAIY